MSEMSQPYSLRGDAAIALRTMTIRLLRYDERVGSVSLLAGGVVYMFG